MLVRLRGSSTHRCYSGLALAWHLVALTSPKSGLILYLGDVFHGCSIPLGTFCIERTDLLHDAEASSENGMTAVSAC